MVHSERSTEAPTPTSGSLLAARTKLGSSQASAAVAAQQSSTVRPIEPSVRTRRFETSRATAARITAARPAFCQVPRAVVKIVDVKCPGSGESAKNNWSNLDRLAPHDEVKFVIADRADYEFARDVIAKHDLASRAAAILLSPVHGVLDPRTLSEWMLADHLSARLQLQLHKFIWHPSTRGV